MKYLILVALSAFLTGTAHAHPAHNEIGMRQEAEALADATNAFLLALDDSQRDRVRFELTDTEARHGWSNLPTSIVPRNGLPISDLDEAQRTALHGMLARGLSSEGYGEAIGVMALDEVLNAQIRQFLAQQGDHLAEDVRAQASALVAAFDPENYWVRIFGVPGSDSWSWVIDGHHLAITATVVDGRIAFTPVFLGADPQTLESGPYAGRRAFQHELDRVADLMASLDAGQIDAIVQSGNREDAVEFAGPNWVPDTDSEPEGLSAADLNEDQQLMLQGAIAEFIGTASRAAAQARLAQIQDDGMDQIRLVWWGDIDDLSQRFMLRIAGPSIHIDFARERQPGGEGVNHFHIIVRDPANEYGEQWLEAHYGEAHADD